jgi:O-antigen/teichoic acid export membrane protein
LEKTVLIGLNIPHSARLKEWGKLLSITGTAQIAIQAISFFSGILMVRMLPIKEYAFYTVANTMLGTMTILADGGISTAVMSQGGRVWNDREKLGAVLASGLALRRQFAVFSLAVAAPAMIYLLRRNGASWSQAILLLLCLIPAFLAALSDTLLEVAPKLRQAVVPLQRNQLAAAVSRLFITGTTLFFLPFAATGIFASGLSRSWANVRLRRITETFANWRQEPNDEIRPEILKVVRRILPTSIYYCAAGQLNIWLLTLLGTPKAVGQLGALSGFSTAFTLFTLIFGTLFVPRFARLPNNRRLLAQRFLLLQVGLLSMSVAIVFLTKVCSPLLLSMLGSRFAGLNKELTLVSAQSCVSMASTSTYQLLSARGIIVPPLLFIVCSIAAQIIFAFLVPLHTISGVLWYGIFTGICVYLVRLIYLGYRFIL